MSRMEYWRGLRNAYRLCFCKDRTMELHHAGKTVMANLRAMVNLDRSAFSSDPIRMAYQLGKQDAVRHMIQMIELTDEKIAQLDDVARAETETEGFGLNGHDGKPFI